MSVVYFLIFWVRGLFRLIQYNASETKRDWIKWNTQRTTTTNQKTQPKDPTKRPNQKTQPKDPTKRPNQKTQINMKKTRAPFTHLFFLILICGLLFPLFPFFPLVKLQTNEGSAWI